MLKLLSIVAIGAISFGFAKADPAPLFKSPRKFYRPGDTIEVSIVKDTTLDVAFCTAAGKAQVFYKIEKYDGAAWASVYSTNAICQSSMAATMQVKKGFTIKHFLLDEGLFRVVVSNKFKSTEFELR